MGLSLKEKLQAMKTEAPYAEAPRARSNSDCKIIRTRHPFGTSEFPEQMNQAVLSWIEGKTEGCAALQREEFLFFDTETTGLSRGVGTVAFLIGAGYFENNALIIEQFFLRDYSEEKYALHHFQSLIERHPVLCSFNGRTFDYPLLESRCVMNRIAFPPIKYHLDLIYPTRRLWKMRIGECKLRCVEEKVLGISRVGDVPGALAPKIYFDYLNTGDTEEINEIIRHNEQDILSLPKLLQAMLTCFQDPQSVSSPEDQYSMGVMFEKIKQTAPAIQCYKASYTGSTALAAREKIAGALQREGKFEEAVQSYQSALLLKRNRPDLHIAISKIYEHRLKDYEKALFHAQKALLYAHETEFEPLMRRIERIQKKRRKKEDIPNGKVG